MGNFFSPQDAIAAFTGQTGAEASLEGARLQSQAALQGIDEQRRQFNILQMLQQPFFNVGVGQLGSLGRSASGVGFEQGLGALAGTDVFNELNAENLKSAQNQLGSAGLSRSGFGLEQIANVPTDTLQGLEALLNERRQALAGISQTASGELGAAGQQTGRGISSLLQQMGQAQAAGGLGAAQSQAQGSQNVASAAIGIASLFSDERLKKNIRKTGELNGVNLYEWEPNEEGKRLGMTMTKGVIAQEIKDKYPDLVSKINGYFAVNYEGLEHRLGGAIWL